MLSQNFPSLFQTSFWMAAASCWISSSHFVAFPLFHCFTLCPAIFPPSHSAVWNPPATVCCWLLWRVLHHLWVELTHHLSPLPDLWLIHQSTPHTSTTSSRQEQVCKKTRVFFPPQLHFPVFLGQKCHFWRAGHASSVMSCLVTYLLTSADCQPSCKTWLSPTEATFLSYHHLSHTGPVHFYQFKFVI